VTLLESIAADLAAYFDPTSGFAQAATLTVAGTDPRPVTVIFVEPYSALDAFGQPAASASPAAILRESEATGAAPGSLLTIDSKTWNVVAMEPDGSGITRLVLSESATHGVQA